MDKTPLKPQFSDESDGSFDPKTKKFIDDIIKICHKHKLALVSENVNDKLIITKITAPALSYIENAKVNLKKAIKSAQNEVKNKEKPKSKANFKFYKNEGKNE